MRSWSCSRVSEMNCQFMTDVCCGDQELSFPSKAEMLSFRNYMRNTQECKNERFGT